MKIRKGIGIFLILCIMMGAVVYTNPFNMVKGLFNDEKSASNIIESNENTKEDCALRDTVLYYKDDKGFLIPVMRKIPWTQDRGIARIALNAMIDTPSNREDIKEIGLQPIIPANTQIRGMTIKEGLCKVDFSKEFLNYFSKEEEESLIKSVVYTLTEFPTIDRVQLMVNGEVPNVFTFGTNVASVMTRDNINYVSQGSSDQKVVVYYESTANGLLSYFVPVTKSIKKEDTTPVNVLDALDALVEGPPEGIGLYTEIPKGTQIIGVDMNESVATINLTEEVLDVVENDQAASSMAKTFGLTLKEQYPNIAGVKLCVNGKELRIGESKTEEPIVVPTFANQYE
ncbi:GerMN domain-containing protein [Inediibacterium massiliense]|uniref:GerMN domain-containing protein n=1 Tax=Inediibacterium massiliense TaxID=1658111 RepID=UPI0006B506EA|nr:GerMN domain-containing protein [Inediibacterium massiliense]